MAGIDPRIDGTIEQLQNIADQVGAEFEVTQRRTRDGKNLVVSVKIKWGLQVPGVPPEPKSTATGPLVLHRKKP
jgi:hypothetical protein